MNHAPHPWWRRRKGSLQLRLFLKGGVSGRVPCGQRGWVAHPQGLLGTLPGHGHHCFLSQGARALCLHGASAGRPQPDAWLTGIAPLRGALGGFSAWQVLGVHSTLPILLLPWGPAPCGPLTWGQGEQGEACAQHLGLPQREKGFCVWEQTLLGTGSQSRGRGNFPPLGVIPGDWSMSPSGWGVGKGGEAQAWVLLAHRSQELLNMVGVQRGDWGDRGLRNG